jgi:phosphoserine aminotransferase
MVGLVAHWLIEQGGLEEMARRNAAKANVLYQTIDASGGFFRGHARADCRSKMNVTFRLPAEDLEKKFVKEAAAQGLLELKGHRSVGGLRASIYNAQPVNAIETLAEFMRAFQKANG